MLGTWAQAHAVTVRVRPAPSGTSADDPVLPSAGPPPPIQQVVVDSEPVLSVVGGSESGAYAVAAVAWCTGPGMEPQLVTAGLVGTMRIWDATSGRVIREFESPDLRDRYSVALTPPGAGRPLIAAGGRSGVLRIWDRETGDLLDSVSDRWIDSLAWLVPGDGRALLGVGATVGAFVWDEHGSPKWTALSEQGSQTSTVYVASGSDPSGRPLLAVGSDDAVSIWDPGGGGRVATLPAPRGDVEFLAWGQAAGRSLLAIADGSDTVAIYDPVSNAIASRIDYDAMLYGIDWGITRDGRLLLATGSDDDTARIWEPLSGAELAVIEHPRDVNSVAFAPAGTVLAAGPGGPAGTETLYLATGSDDAYARVYAVHVPAGSGRPRPAPARRPAAILADPGEPVRGRAEPVDAVEAIDGPVVLPQQSGWLWTTEWAVNDNGQAWLACCGAIGGVKVFEPFAGEVVADLATGAITDKLSWGRLPDGRLLLAAGNRNGEVHIWDSADWQAAPRTFQTESRQINGLDLIAFGDRMLAAVTPATGSARLIVWDVLSGDRLAELAPEAGSVYAVEWVTEGDDLLLAMGSTSHQVSICRPLSGEILDTISSNNRVVWAVDWARDDEGRLLLAIAGDPGTVQVWDRRADSVIATFNTGRTSVLSACWGITPQGRLLLAVGGETGAEVWDPLSGRRLARIEHSSGVHNVSFAPPGVRPDEPDRIYLAVGCQNGALLVHALRVTEAPAGAGGDAGRDWPVSAGVPRGRLAPLDGVRFIVPGEPETILRGHQNDTIWALHPAVAPDGRTLLASAGQDATARVWDLATSEQVAVLECESPVESVAWTALGRDRLVLVAAEWSAPRIWETPGGQVRALSTDYGSRFVSWVTLADGNPRIVVNRSGDVVLVDPDTGSAEIRLESDEADASVESVAGLRAAGRSYVAAGYASGRILVWEPESGNVLASLAGNSGQVLSLAWAVGADGRVLLASGSRDGTVRIWDVLAGECQASLSRLEPAWDLGWAVLADGRLVLAVTGDNRAAELLDPVRAVVVAQVGDEGRSAAGVTLVSVRAGDQDGLLAVCAYRGEIHVFRVGVEGVERTAGTAAGFPAGRVGPVPGRSELESFVSGVVMLGEWGVWGALGLLGDLIELLDPVGDAGQLGERLNDPRLADLAPDPVLAALRGLGWRGVRARLGLAGLVIATLVPGPGFVPPAGTGPEERVAALLRALAADSPYLGGAPGTEELRRALEGVPPGAPMLLDLAGEQTVAADPGLPVRLIAAAGVLPVLGPDVLAMVSRSVRRMDRRDPWLAPGRAGGGMLDLAQDPVDRDLIPVLTRRGRPDRVVPTHLALPERVRVPMQATGGLLFRHHADPPAVLPSPVTIALDVSPAVFGPVEVVLRLVAHLLTVAVWQAGGQVSLVTTARPQVVIPLEQRADLVSVWTARSLQAPDLHAVSRTAAGLDQPVVVLTHHATALDQGLRAGPGVAGVTTDTPGAPVAAGHPTRPGGRAEPRAAGYHRLPPRPAPDEFSAVLDALLDYLSDPEAVA